MILPANVEITFAAAKLQIGIALPSGNFPCGERSFMYPYRRRSNVPI
jgi:hypothetical protein